MTRKQPKRTPRPGVDAYGRTPLHYAVVDADVERVHSLLQSGSDPDARDDNGWAPLHFAAQASSAAITARLLAAGARADVRDANGNTPLSSAVFNSRGDGSVIGLLLGAGADPRVPNHYGVSPVALARTIANYDVAQFFTEVPDG